MKAVTDVTTPGRWYDPISERWIEPRHVRMEESGQASENHVLELQRKDEIQRIWRALVDCCARE
jgi:hypothetical protein